MGCSPDHPAARQDGEVARGWAGSWRKVVPVLVGCDAPGEIPPVASIRGAFAPAECQQTMQGIL